MDGYFVKYLPNGDIVFQSESGKRVCEFGTQEHYVVKNILKSITTGQQNGARKRKNEEPGGGSLCRKNVFSTGDEEMEELGKFMEGVHIDSETTMDVANSNNQELKTFNKEVEAYEIRRTGILPNGCIFSIILGWCCRKSLTLEKGVLTTKWCKNCQKRTWGAKYP